MESDIYEKVVMSFFLDLKGYVEVMLWFDRKGRLDETAGYVQLLVYVL
jgi:hypothetical protein